MHILLEKELIGPYEEISKRYADKVDLFKKDIFLNSAVVSYI